MPLPRAPSPTWLAAALAALALLGCGARSELSLGPVPHEPDCDHGLDGVRPDGVDGCVRYVRLGAEGAAPSTHLQRFLEGNGASVERALDDGRPLTRALLDRYDVAILESPTRTYAPDEAEALRDWVEDGGGFFVTSGYRPDGADRSQTNSLIAGLGVSFVGALLNDNVTSLADHPSVAGLTIVPFVGGYEVAVTPSSEGTEAPVAFLSGARVGVAQERGTGRAFVWGDEWVEFDDEWVSGNDTPSFWRVAIRWLAHQDP